MGWASFWKLPLAKALGTKEQLFSGSIHQSG